MRPAREIAREFVMWLNDRHGVAGYMAEELAPLIAAIEARDREVVEACAAKVEGMYAVLPAFCAKTAANWVRSLAHPKGTT